MTPAASSLPTRSCTAGDERPTARASSAQLARPLALSSSISCLSTASIGPLPSSSAPGGADRPRHRLPRSPDRVSPACVRWGLRRGWDVPFLVLLVIAVVVVVLVVRASNAPGRRPGGTNLPRPPRSPPPAP